MTLPNEGRAARERRARVVVMRHGHRAAGEGDAGLSPRGVSGARAAAEWMVDHALRPDLVLTTTAPRTVESAALVLETLCRADRRALPRVERVRSFPDNVAGWMRLIGRFPLRELRCTLLVVHRPTQHLVERSFGGERFGVPRRNRAAVFVLAEDGEERWCVEDAFSGLPP